MNPNNDRYKLHNQQLILIALIDGQWHRNKELKEKTKLTPRTLSKHLNELNTELHLIERREDTQSGEYPHPVLYRAPQLTVSFATYIKKVWDNADDMEPALMESKDPLLLLEKLHKLNLYYFTQILGTIQEDKCIPQKVIEWLTNLFIHEPYEICTKNIITAFTKAVQLGGQFDIDKLRQNHDVWDGLSE